MLVFLCLLLVFLISAVQIFRIIRENRHSQAVQQELEMMFFQESSEQERSISEDSQSEPEAPDLPAYDFTALLELNESGCGTSRRQ